MPPDKKSKPAKKPVILITGGAGFLGQAIIRELTADNKKALITPREIRVFDIRQSPHDDSRIVSITGDIQSVENLINACDGVDIIIHCAALIDWGQRSEKEVHSVNVGGTKNVITAAVECGVTTLLYTSTMDVLYGGKAMRDADESTPYPESFDMIYARTKATAEQAVIAANGKPVNARGKHTDGTLRTCVIRPCGMFGEGDPYHVSSFVKMARQGKLKFRIGSGKSVFQHVYVGNVAHAHVLAVQSLLQPRSRCQGQVYFVTDFPAKNFFDYMAPILEGIGHDMPPRGRSIPYPIMYTIASIVEVFTRALKPFVRLNPIITRTSVSMVCKDLTFSCAKAQKDLGYAPVYAEQDAINRTIAYFKKYGPV